MQNFISIITLLLSIILISSCKSQTKEHKISKEGMEAIVKKQNALLTTYFKTGNAEKLASLYTDSAKLSPNAGDFVIGKENIKAFWKKDFESSQLLEMETKVFTTEGTEAIIYETGKTTTKTLYQDSVYKFTVKYINVWVKQPDGNYQLDVDFWNADN